MRLVEIGIQEKALTCNLDADLIFAFLVKLVLNWFFSVWRRILRDFILEEADIYSHASFQPQHVNFVKDKFSHKFFTLVLFLRKVVLYKLALPSPYSRKGRRQCYLCLKDLLFLFQQNFPSGQIIIFNGNFAILNQKSATKKDHWGINNEKSAFN